MSQNTHPKESVYNWISLLSKDETESTKPKRYVSKFRPAVVLESKLQNGEGKMMKTMGPAKVELPSPDDYLKKHSKEPKLPEQTDSKDPHHTHFCTMRKPAVPARTEQPLIGIPTKRDFRETTIYVPKKPEHIQVDTHQGTRKLLENSGLAPHYIMKHDYGKTPVYLQKRKEAEQKAQEHDRLVREERRQGAIQRLPDEERQAVLEGLKKEWDTCMQMYQRIPFLVEMPSQKAHKIELEKAMDELEKKISFVERFKIIYIANGEVSYSQ